MRKQCHGQGHSVPTVLQQNVSQNGNCGMLGPRGQTPPVSDRKVPGICNFEVCSEAILKVFFKAFLKIRDLGSRYQLLIKIIWREFEKVCERASIRSRRLHVLS